MLDYRHILVRYRFVKDYEIERVILPRWQSVDQFSYDGANAQFLNLVKYDRNASTAAAVSFFASRAVFFNRDEFGVRQLPTSCTAASVGDDFLSEFFYLRKSSFVSFFINSLVDVPVCFKKSASLHTRAFELPVLKFSNFLMRAGKREKIVRVLFYSARQLMSQMRNDGVISRGDVRSWLDLYRLVVGAAQFNYGLSAPDRANRMNTFLKSRYGVSFNDRFKHADDRFFLKNYLQLRLSSVSPVFSYFIYSVDKNIRKFSRGKSGKYTFVWKYVAPYKRRTLAMRWIAKDIKFSQQKTASDRILKTLIGLTVAPEASFAWKSKIFAHNYVFRNFRKSLMSTLRTSA